MTAGKTFFVIIGILVLSTSHAVAQHNNLLWRWVCDSSTATCTRVSVSTQPVNDALYPSLEICRLVCGNSGGLWPQPTRASLSNQLFSFCLSSLNFVFPPETSEVRSFLKDAASLFVRSISQENWANCQLDSTVTVSFTVSTDEMDLTWNTNEGYKLEIINNGNDNSVNIQAATVFGARHALETLSQLIDSIIDNNQVLYVMVKEAQIRDGPVFPHRGLLLDTARNYLSIPMIKKHIDGMACSKLNVLHWHITDSQSFPLEVPSLPNMTKYGAYSDDKIYRASDIADLQSYAKLRGVRIIIEIDAPSHSGNGWQWGSDAGLGNLAVCLNQQPWRSYCIQPPCGQLNPINPNLYAVLKNIYSDIVTMLPNSETFHMGGDEVFIPCWNSTPEIIRYLENTTRSTDTFLDLWSFYQSQALAAFDQAVGNVNTPIIVWTSHLTDITVINKYLPKERYVIQTWVPADDTLPKDLLALGYRIIVSTKDAWYLDHGFWGSTVYHGWRNVYNNKIPTDPGTLGGEVCMWGEYVDDTGTESRVWPRAAAAAERLWSNPKTNDQNAEPRFYRHRERLISRGINADALIPRWCYQNEGQC